MKRFCLSAAFAILASFAPAQTATVIECERDAAFDYWASSDVKFCTRVMNRVFGIANVQPQFAGYRDDGRPEIDAPEVICSTFRTPKLLRDYDFPLQSLGKKKISSLFSILRQVIITVPLIIIADKFLGFYAICAVPLIADIITDIVASFILRRTMKDIKAEFESGKEISL